MIGKSIRMLLRILFGFVAAAFLVLLFFSIVFLEKPHWILNNTTLQLGSAILSRQGVAVTWSDVSVEIDPTSALTRRLSLDFRGLCIREAKKSAYRSCFSRARIAAAGGFRHLIPQVTELGPISFEDGMARIRPELMTSQKKREAQERSGEPFRVENLLPYFLQHAEVKPIQMDISDWQLETRDQRLSGDFFISEFPTRAEGARVLVHANGATVQTRGAFRKRETYSLKLDARNDRNFWAWNHWTINGNASAMLADRRSIELELGVQPHFIPVQETKRHWLRRNAPAESVALDFKMSGKTRKGIERISTTLQGSYRPGMLAADLKARALDLIPDVPVINVPSCHFELSRADLKPDSRYRTNCRITGEVPVARHSFQFLQLPNVFGITIDADLQSTDFIPSDTSVLQGDAEVAIDPVLTPLIEGRAQVKAHLDGRIGEFPRAGKVQTTSAIELKVPDFQRLSTELARTRYGIPAPFQSLQGDVILRTGGTANLEQGIFPMQFRTRLHSTHQNFNIDSNGTFEISDIRTDPSGQLNIAVMLSDFKLILPKLALGKPPRFVPDARVHPIDRHKAVAVRVAEKKSESSMGYRIVIRTPPDKPAQIITQLAKAPIPVGLDLRISDDQPILGTVSLGSFPVEAFRRKATVQHFTIDLDSEAGNSAIDGRVDVPLGDYQSHIELVGTIDKPQVKVTSDPPVGEDELVSALLFNRNPQDLDPGQTAAVGSTRATISQGALSLASLFLLASTPIESLNYNPDTGQVTAQVRIAEGLSLNLGSGENQSGDVGLRQRLGRNFFITTDVSNIVQNTSTVSAYLEWRKRY